MGDIKNVSDEHRMVPWLGNRLVLAGAVVSVPDADEDAYTCQEGVWAAVKKTKAAKTAAKES